MSKKTLFGLILFVIVVLAIITFFCFFFGSFTGGMMYVTWGNLENGSQTLIYHGTTGMIAGSIGAFLVGVAWCVFMIRKAFRIERNKLTKVGSDAGILAGVVSTLILHFALLTECHLWNLKHVIGELIFGLPFGIMVGWINGILCAKILQKIVDPLLPKNVTTETWLNRNYRLNK